MTRCGWAAFLLLTLCVSAVGAAAYPFPQAVRYPHGIKPGVRQAALNRQVQKAYDDWLSRYLTWEGAPAGCCRIHRGAAFNYDTVSEGIAWGMLITVLMDNQKNQTKPYFDGLWNYYRSYLNRAGLMSWRVNSSGEVTGEDSATEADENAALALLYAEKQWGSGETNDYGRAARELIARIMSAEVESGTYFLKPGAFWGGSGALNPMYFDLAYYRIWTRFDPNWQKVLDSSVGIYELFYNKYQTGLFPDWTTAAGTPAAGLGYDYYYDACQVPLKLSLDFLWHGESGKYLDRLSFWLVKQSRGRPSALSDGYRLDGTPVSRNRNASFLGPFCTAAMVSGKYQSWLNKLYKDLVKLKTGGGWGYYPDTVRLVSLLIVSGNCPNLWP